MAAPTLLSDECLSLNQCQSHKHSWFWEQQGTFAPSSVGLTKWLWYFIARISLYHPKVSNDFLHTKYFLKWNVLIISKMKYAWWHTCNKMLLIIEKQLVRTINIKLGDVELNLQWRKYFYFSVKECMLLSNMFMLILKKILFIKILKIGTIWTFASKMMKETYLSLFFLLCRSQNPGCYNEKGEEVSER